eukprot:3479985-Rhodomonas_salina.3
MKEGEFVFRKLLLPPGSAMVNLNQFRKKGKNRHNPKDRLWLANRYLRIQTHVNTPDSAWNGITPRHLYRFLNDNPVMLLQQAAASIKQYFIDIAHPMHPMHNRTCYFEERGLTFSPSNTASHFDKDGKAMKMHDFRTVLAAQYPLLHKLWSKYERELELILGLNEKQLEQRGTLMFIKYNTGKGLWTHIDNVRRSDGFVVSVGLGVPVLFDMAPSLLAGKRGVSNDGFVLRTRIDAGDMILLDGEARFEWCHGIPEGRDTEKYTIFFLCDHISPKCDHYNKDILERVYTSIPCTQ